MIAIVDYGVGNLGSIQNMFTRIGAQSLITSESETIENSDKLVLPGVGAFDTGMNNLERLGLITILNKQVLERGVPILGICLGMQLFSSGSEEGSAPGLGWIEAQTIRFHFDEDSNLRIPHMGWDSLDVRQSGSILDGRSDESRYYFVHSYHVRCKHESNVLATTNYGIVFHSAVIKENIIGMQFHPEKSHKFGMKLLRNFSES
jgi:glutamine amidotransferase